MKWWIFIIICLVVYGCIIGYDVYNRTHETQVYPITCDSGIKFNYTAINNIIDEEEIYYKCNGKPEILNNLRYPQ